MEIKELQKKAEDLYRNGDYLCSEAVFSVVNESLGCPLPPEAVRILSGFPVGIGCAGCTCGALTGAIAALGIKYGRSIPKDENQKVLELSKELYEEFVKLFGSSCCRVIIKDFTFGSEEHLEHCIGITGEATRMVLERL